MIQGPRILATVSKSIGFRPSTPVDLEHSDSSDLVHEMVEATHREHDGGAEDIRQIESTRRGGRERDVQA